MFVIDSQTLRVGAVRAQREEVEIGAGIRVVTPIDMNRLNGRRRCVGLGVQSPVDVCRDGRSVEPGNSPWKIVLDCPSIL